MEHQDQEHAERLLIKMDKKGTMWENNQNAILFYKERKKNLSFVFFFAL